MENTLSGKAWIAWANKHAINSNDVEDLEDTFKTNVKDFISALEKAGATITIDSTKRSAKRAYLFHLAWRIALKKVEAKEATKKEGVPINWVHSKDNDSIAAADEMVKGFGLAVPPKSTVAPSLTSNHITGKAIDMEIKWTGTIEVKKKDGSVVKVTFQSDVKKNTDLHDIGKSYDVIKHLKDTPHWSVNGK